MKQTIKFWNGEKLVEIIAIIKSKTRKGKNRIAKAKTNEWRVIDETDSKLCLIPSNDTSKNESGQWF